MLCVALALAGCQSDWSMSGSVTVEPGVNHDRQLMVLLYRNVQLSNAGLPKSDGSSSSYALTAQEQMQGSSISYGYVEVGCNVTNFQIVVWSPKNRIPLPGEQQAVPTDFLAPLSGDYLAKSEILTATGCGDGPQQLPTLTLTAEELVTN